MADMVLLGIVEEIIGDLTLSALKPLLGEIRLLWSLKAKVEGLKGTFSTIKAVLLDAEEKNAHNHQMKNWLMKLKDAAYDTEDFLDDLTAEALKRKLMAGNLLTREVRLFFSRENHISYAYRMTHRAKAIKKRLDKIAADKHNFQLDMHSEDRQVVLRPSHSFVRKGYVGRENVKNAVIDSLLKPDERKDKSVSVVAIVGIGGMGKTALAQCIFNDENVEKQFALKIWACISENFHFDAVVKKILEGILGSEVKDLGSNILATQLRDKIVGEKYLLILDDLWNEDREKWLDLECILGHGAQGSRILVTTRGAKVADVASASSVHNLRCLTHEESWSLFKHVAFKEDQEPENKNLIDLGNQIVGKCCGVPLVITAIGSILYGEGSQDKWDDLKNKDLLEIDQESQYNLMKILSLSYKSLPSYLKHCFAYCSLFSKDSQIPIQLLIRHWMAQGFVKLSSKKQCLEDAAFDYFHELYRRGFFQEMEVNELGYGTCKMHDLMHDLAIHVAGPEISILNSDKDDVNPRCRHVSLNFSLDVLKKIPLEMAKRKKLRTIFFRWEHMVAESLNKEVCGEIFARFKYLRVLDISGAGIEEIPIWVSKLKHLKYLDLSYNHFKIVPSSLVEAINLQTLVLQGCSELQFLPIDIRGLVNLRHLEIKGCDNIQYMPLGFGHLTTLRVLSHFVVNRTSLDYGAGVNELKRLNSLSGRLTIRNLADATVEKIDPEAAYIKDKTGLKKLQLEWDRPTQDDACHKHDEAILEGLQPPSNIQYIRVQGYRGTKSPSWMRTEASLPQLVRLQLFNCRGFNRLPSFLEKGHNLKCIQLWLLPDLEFVDEKWRSSHLQKLPFFPSLEKLSLRELINFKGWWKEIDNRPDHLPSFPRLSKLNIGNCPILSSTSMPLQPYLKELDLFKVSSEFMVRELQVLTRTPPPPCSSSTSIHPLSKLEKLVLNDIYGLTEFRAEWVQNLNSLKDLSVILCHMLLSIPDLSNFSSLRFLKFSGCVELKFLPHGIKHLPNLEEILIDVNLEMADDEYCQYDENESFKSLRKLEIRNVGEALPCWIQRLPALHELKINRSNELRSLPHLVSNFPSLEQLEIWYCPNLTLPESIRDLPSLKRLHIHHCDTIEVRCKKDDGEDWPKIAHITYIDINSEVIQDRRRRQENSS